MHTENTDTEFRTEQSSGLKNPCPENLENPCPKNPCPENPAVGCYGVSRRFGSLWALQNVELELPPGQIIGLLGPNGSGKTTLLKILAGILPPTGGDVRLAGMPVGCDTKKIVSFLPERNPFPASYRVRDCMDMYTAFYPDFDAPRVRALLPDAGISPDFRLKTLSKGMLEKVRLLLALGRRAQVYLFDEPLGGVDPAARAALLGLMQEFRSPEATMLLSTHLLADAEPILDGYVFLCGGWVLESGTMSALRQRTGQSVDEHFREVFRCS